MPKVYLTQEDRLEAEEDRELAHLTDLIRTARYRLDVPDSALAKAVGVSGARFSQLKADGAVDGVSLRRARRIAHAVGCTAEDWLRIGGF